jgi:hypothetical protein
MATTKNITVATMNAISAKEVLLLKLLVPGAGNLGNANLRIGGTVQNRHNFDPGVLPVRCNCLFTRKAASGAQVQSIANDSEQWLRK